MSRVPADRIRAANDAPVRRDGDHVLVWTTAFRRTGWSFTLDRAVEWSRELRRPVLVLEALRAGYPHASDRLHAFVLQGMAEAALAFADAGIGYHPYVEPEAGHGRGLLEALSARACVVVADDAPFFFLPRMLEAAARRLAVRVEAVDSNGLLPVRLAGAAFPTAHAFRRFVQREVRERLAAFPSTDPLDADGAAGAEVPDAVARRWPRASSALLAVAPEALRALPIDHGVPPVASSHGGGTAARAALHAFVEGRLARYPERSHPDADASSGLSPWLHFGQISAHEVFRAVVHREGWKPARLGSDSSGKREGFWGMSPEAEAFLDELVTWRELGFNMLARRPDAAWDFDTLPPWAIRTLEAHAGDPRDPCYTRDELERAATHDEVWNAAQRELLVHGRIHNYLRMLWGKKILQWSPSPREALARMLHLNDRWALDGRDPNSASGIFWCLGRYDRPWAPERPVFGVIRYMSSENTVRKLHLRQYLQRHGAQAGLPLGG
ncbi:MAG TPA: deoxyribodipyrimidine photolyase [Anaeromyxobacteraceae bacterium]|nr:deoxyribodipyrimidine photolyase [Anaeromyxobacteraceae bacterium]